MTRSPRRTLSVAALAATVAVFPLAACSGTEVPVAEATTVVPVPEDETSASGEPSPSSPSSSEADAAGTAELEEGSVSQQQLGDKVGQDVIFAAQVAEVISPSVLSVGGQDAGQQPALVVGADLPADVQAGDTLQVRGTVQEFDPVVVQQEGGADLDAADLTAYEGLPYILAATALRQ